MKQAIREHILTKYSAYLIGLILVLLPFHAVFTTWLGASYGHIDLFRIWKELLMVPLGILVLIWLATDSRLRRALKPYQTLCYLMVIYSLLTIALGLWARGAHHVNSSALLYALVVNLRFLAFFVICLVIASKSPWLKQHWQELVLYPAAIVVGFGLLQQFVLPANILSHVGYGPHTIAAYQTVDQESQYVRIQSTLRGPNPLGAYLVLIAAVLIAFYLSRKTKYQLMISLGLVATAIVLLFTYSRSGWLGTALAALLVVYWSIHSQLLRRWLLVLTAGVLIIGGGLTVILRHNTVFENTLFHTSQVSRSPDSSNAVRTEAQLNGLKSVIHQPLGNGPGTAGPASFRNNHPPRIAENYFIQIGQEVGILGLGLFLVINFLIAKSLWQQKQRLLPGILLASLLGLTLVNLLSHAWADDTLSLIWWGLAGIALAPGILKDKPKRYEKAQIITTT